MVFYAEFLFFLDSLFFMCLGDIAVISERWFLPLIRIEEEEQ